MELMVILSYEVLVDDHAREMYDQYGLNGTNGGSHGVSPEDLFEGLFGAQFGGGGGPFMFTSTGRKRRGDDSRIPYEVTLEDLYTGKNVK